MSSQRTPGQQPTLAGALPLRRSPVRFAVGSPNGTTSNTWRVWTNGDDVYLACRDNFKETKVSLHASGRWRMGYTNEALARNANLVGAGQDRAWEVWDEPPATVPNVVVAFHLYFLGSELAVRPEQRKHKDWASVLHVEGPSSGSMVTVTLFVTSGDLLLEADGRPSLHLASLQLENGRFAQLVARVDPEGKMPDLLAAAAAAARRQTDAAGVATPAEAYGYFFGHDDNGARFIVGGRINR